MCPVLAIDQSSGPFGCIEGNRLCSIHHRAASKNLTCDRLSMLNGHSCQMYERFCLECSFSLCIAITCTQRTYACIVKQAATMGFSAVTCFCEDAGSSLREEGISG